MRIGELARAAGMDVETLRFYEKAGLLPAPARGDNNYRRYDGAALQRLRLRGLMTIPEIAPDFEAARAIHARARALFDQLNAHGLALDTLSMGMSADLEAAVAAGSTMVRVGSAIFGARG